MASIRKREWVTDGKPQKAYVVDFRDPRGKRHREQFPDKAQAEDRLLELKTLSKVGGQKPDAKKLTVRDVCEMYIKHEQARQARNEITRSYLTSTEQQIRDFINPPLDADFEHGLGGMRLSNVTAGRVNEWRDAMRDHGVGVVTVRRTIATLGRMFKFAIDRDLAVNNPAIGITVAAPRHERREKVVAPTKTELATLIEKANDRRFALAIKFAAATGARASEQWALRWRHVDLDSAKVTIETRVDAFGQFDVTKSEAGRREVPLGAAMVEALRAWRKESKFNEADDFVFPDQNGGYQRHNNINKRRWTTLRKRANVTHVDWHSLRHFAITNWITAGMPPKAVSSLAGHSTVALTIDRYTDYWPKDDHRAVIDALAKEIF